MPTSKHQRLLLLLVLCMIASLQGCDSILDIRREPGAMTLSQYTRGTTLELPLQNQSLKDEWLNDCRSECESQSKPHPDYELEEETVLSCEKDCQEMLSIELEDECMVIEIPSGSYSIRALGICTKDTCVLAPRGLFPSSVRGLDLHHYRNLLAYCIKAGMDPRFVVPHVDTTDELLSQSFSYSNKKIRMYDFISSLPELDESPLVGITRAVMRTHPEATVLINSVSRSYLDKNRSYKRMNKFFVHYISHKSQPRIDYEAFSNPGAFPRSLSLVNHESSPEEGLLQMLFGMITQTMIPTTTAGINKPVSADNFNGCYLNLVRSSSLSALWTISSSQDIDSHGYELILATELPLYPPSLLFSNYYLADLCQKVKQLRVKEEESNTPLGKFILGIDLYEYTYPYNKLQYPSSLKPVVLGKSFERVWSTPVLMTHEY